uniref:NADH dehydrogenase subunit 5 n=1 Tax=Gnathophyllum americanum TaxID=390955 RepID=UPI003001AC48
MNFSSMVFLMIISFSSFLISLTMLGMDYCYFLSWDLVSLNTCVISMSLIFDWMSLMFISFVCFISGSVLYYSGSYMSGDYNIVRFMYLVLMFVTSMLFLIVSPNLISILLGWDGLGLVSYVLVIYYQNDKSSAAGMLTALSNRVGDVAILISIGMMSYLGTWDFLFYSDISLKGNFCLFFVILAAMTKSAQIPFSAWLPAAMAAPTPVSALVHSSTLVTAGVYLLIRFSPSLVGFLGSDILFLLGCATMFMAGLGANFETDLKKIIALSTLSQLGVMISILALGRPDLAFFHLLAHALFKALLFMCAGSIIHGVGDSQDIRTMGGLVNFMPLSVMLMNLANLSLCGMPFLAGFYSKDLILESAFLVPLNEVCFWLYVVSTGLTVCYTFRLIYYSLSGNYNLNSTSLPGDEAVMTNSMFGLALGAVLSGSALSWLIFPAPSMICLSFFLKLTPLLVCILGMFVGYMLNLMVVNSNIKSLLLYKVVVFSGSMWFLPFLSTLGVSSVVLKSGFLMYRSGDMGWSEYYGGQGMYGLMSLLSNDLYIVQNNSIKVNMFLLVVLIFSVLLLM